MSAEYEERERLEQAETRRQAEHLKALCHEIAVNLPGDWVTVAPDDEEEIRAGGPGLARADWPGRDIRQQDGHGRINIRMGGYQHKGRIVADAEWNGLCGHSPYGKSCPKITVRDDRTGEQVAKAIASRLLPKYLPLLAQAVERKTAYDDAAAKAARLALELAEATGGKVQTRNKNTFPGDTVWVDGLGPVYVDSDGDVCFERSFRVSFEKAVRLIKIYQEE